MSGLCFFLIMYLCPCILYPHLGISAASKAQLHLGPSSLHSAPFLASLELLESRQAQSCPQDICPCCSPHSSEIPMDFPSYLLVSMQRPLLRRPSCTILFKLQTIPTFSASSLFFSLKELFNSHHLLPPTPTLHWFIVYSVPRAGP